MFDGDEVWDADAGVGMEFGWVGRWGLGEGESGEEGRGGVSYLVNAEIKRISILRSILLYRLKTADSMLRIFE